MYFITSRPLTLDQSFYAIGKNNRWTCLDKVAKLWQAPEYGKFRKCLFKTCLLQVRGPGFNTPPVLIPSFLLPLIQEGQLSVTGESMCTCHLVLVNGLGGLSLPRNSVVRLTDRPDMTITGGGSNSAPPCGSFRHYAT